RVVDLEARAKRNRGGEIPAGLRLPQRADRRDLAVRVPIGARDTRVVRRGIADEPNERDRSAATLDEVNRLLDERVIARRRVDEGEHEPGKLLADRGVEGLEANGFHQANARGRGKREDRPGELEAQMVVE